MQSILFRRRRYVVNNIKTCNEEKRSVSQSGQRSFATSHSHMNYYIDITMQKSRLSEAKSIAHEIVSSYRSNTIVDTVLCLDGTEVIGTCIADELTKEDFANMNAHQTIYIVTPEYTSGSQILFRDNVVPMIASKHVLIFAASVTTGLTAKAAAEAVRYYGGKVAGISSVFATVDSCEGYPVISVFNPKDIPDYETFDSHECPYCKRSEKIDALVNSHGFSLL